MRADVIRVARLGILLIFCGLFASTASAQNVQFTQGNVSPGLDNTIQIPLQAYPGRGGTSLQVNISYSSRVWRIKYLKSVQENISGFQVRRAITEAVYGENSAAGWTTSLDVPRIQWPEQNDFYWFDGRPYHTYIYPYTFRVARVYIHLPDGSSHEFRKSDQPYSNGNIVDMQGTFYAVDSSRMRFDATGLSATGQSTGTLYLPDGARYILEEGTVKFIDRNGNTLHYDRASRQWTDTLGRAITIPLPANPQAIDYPYTLPGVSKPYIFKWRHLSGALLPGSGSLKNASTHYLPDHNQEPTNQGGGNFPLPTQGESLFSSYQPDDSENASTYTYVVGQGQPFNPVVLAEVELPNGLSYKFSYNIYGEISKVTYPTDAHELYEMGQVTPLAGSGMPYDSASRGVTQRKLSADGTGNDYAIWNYSSTGTKVTTKSPDGTEREVYSYNGRGPFGFEEARNSLSYDERVYAPGPNGQRGPMMRRKLTEWQLSSNTVPPRPNVNQAGNNSLLAYRNPRPTKEVSLILDTGGNALAKNVTYTYDTSNQLTTGLDMVSSTESHFAEVDQNTAQTGAINLIPAGAVAQISEMGYKTDSSYRARNILGLPTYTIVKDAGSNVVAKSEIFYDEFGSYPLMPYGDLGADYTNPGTTVRGLATTTRRYIDVGIGLSLETNIQYDQCGNVRVSINERDVQTLTEYSSTYKHAYPTQDTTAAPDPLGQRGSAAGFTSSINYDYTTGVVLSTTDANGRTTNYSYRDEQDNPDPLNRLRKIERPDGGWTKYTYNDAVGDLYALTETLQENSTSTRVLATYQYFDALGRVSRTFLKENNTIYLATATEYDKMGRVKRTSNPYRTSTRSSNGGGATDWITSDFDSLGRVVSETFPDLTTSQTVYQGVFTTVTDQAGKKRRQLVDAQGRIVRVDETDLTGDLGPVNGPKQPTSYRYDTLGNIIHVAQNYDLVNNVSGVYAGVQHRYFKYDALSRLTYERQVEQAAVFSATDSLTGNNQWSRRIVYDENGYKGLVTSQYDARQIHTSFTYDDLNRVTDISYSDGVTPGVSYFYDTAKFTHQQETRDIYNLGRLTKVNTASLSIPSVAAIPETSQAYNYDSMGRVANTRQTVGTINPYFMLYTYDLGGALRSERYPSDRVVNYEYGDAGRLQSVSSGGTTYASQFKYEDPRGLLSSFLMGNASNLVKESYSYNSRLQLESLELKKGNSVMQRYEYKYGQFISGTLNETKNNGQIAQIDSVVGTSKQWRQQFEYDSLGRLNKTTEYEGTSTSSPTYQMNYEYDVFGNRYQNSGNNANSLAYVEVADAHISKFTNRFIVAGVQYDDAGNITSDSRFTQLQYSYDANNRQRQVSQLDGTGVVQSVYDGTGQRVATMVNNTVNNVLVYNAGGKLVGEYGQTAINRGTSYIFTDHQSSTRVVTDSTGTVMSRHDYQSFGGDIGAGVGLRTTGLKYGQANSARQKYAGMEADDGSTNSHTLWRKYDSSSGRWTSPDPYAGSMTTGDPQSFNRYNYVNNDPINHVDPTGLYLQDIGVYQTSNPAAARYLEKNATWRTLTSATRMSGGQARIRSGLSQAFNRATAGNLGVRYARIRSGDGLIYRYASINICTTYLETAAFSIPIRSEQVGVGEHYVTATIEYSFDEPTTPELSDSDKPEFGKRVGTDDRGHIVARALGGSNDSENLFWQNRSINRNAYQAFEYNIRRTLTEHQDWTAKLRIQLLYPESDCDSPRGNDNWRPYEISYEVTYYRRGKRVDYIEKGFANPKSYR